MTEDQFEAASQLRRERTKIATELAIWENELRSKDKLGYLQGWNNNHATRLESSIPDDLFSGFRTAAINALKVKLVEIDAAFENL